MLQDGTENASRKVTRKNRMGAGGETGIENGAAKNWLFAIYMGKPVGSRVGQMVSKIQDWWIWYRNRVYHLYKSVPFTEKQPRRPETGIKDGFEEMEHEFPSGTFRPEKTGLPFQMFRCSRIVSTGTTQKPCSIYFPSGFSETFL